MSNTVLQISEISDLQSTVHPVEERDALPIDGVIGKSLGIIIVQG